MGHSVNAPWLAAFSQRSGKKLDAATLSGLFPDYQAGVQRRAITFWHNALKRPSALRHNALKRPCALRLALHFLLLLQAGHPLSVTPALQLGSPGRGRVVPFARHGSRCFTRHPCGPLGLRNECPPASSTAKTHLHASTTEGQEKPDPLRLAYQREREAREKKLLQASKQVDMAKLFEQETQVNYADKDRNFRVRNFMLDPSADSDWADEAVNNETNSDMQSK